jgi:THO complex subunit 2
MAPPREASSLGRCSLRVEGPVGPRGGEGMVVGGRSEGGGHGGGRGEDYGGRSGSSRGGNAPPRDQRPSRPGDERGDERARKRRSEGVDAGSHQDKRQRR